MLDCLWSVQSRSINHEVLNRYAESIVADHRVEGVPTLVLANKQDAEHSMPVEEIKETFNKHVVKLNVSEGAVMSISALTGYIQLWLLSG